MAANCLFIMNAIGKKTFENLVLSWCKGCLAQGGVSANRRRNMAAIYLVSNLSHCNRYSAPLKVVFQWKYAFNILLSQQCVSEIISYPGEIPWWILFKFYLKTLWKELLKMSKKMVSLRAKMSKFTLSLGKFSYLLKIIWQISCLAFSSFNFVI